MRSVIALAAALASVAVAQDGLGGNFCGNTLGNKKALADPIKGTGKLTFTGRPVSTWRLSLVRAGGRVDAARL